MTDERVTSKLFKDEGFHIGHGVWATFDASRIVLDLRAESDALIVLEPAVFVALMRFARVHLGEDVFREVDRMAGGGLQSRVKNLEDALKRVHSACEIEMLVEGVQLPVSDDPPPVREIPQCRGESPTATD